MRHGMAPATHNRGNGPADAISCRDHLRQIRDMRAEVDSAVSPDDGDAVVGISAGRQGAALG
jgi:hypothetical protein